MIDSFVQEMKARVADCDYTVNGTVFVINIPLEGLTVSVSNDEALLTFREFFSDSGNVDYIFTIARIILNKAMENPSGDNFKELESLLKHLRELHYKGLNINNVDIPHYMFMSEEDFADHVIDVLEDETLDADYNIHWTAREESLFESCLKLKRAIGEPIKNATIHVSGLGSLNDMPCDYLGIWKLPFNWLECQNWYANNKKILNADEWHKFFDPLYTSTDAYVEGTSAWYNFADHK